MVTSMSKSGSRSQVEVAIDPQTLDELSRQTGLSRDELVKRIARDLPATVDTMTPEGRLRAGRADPAR